MVVTRNAITIPRMKHRHLKRAGAVTTRSFSAAPRSHLTSGNTLPPRAEVARTAYLFYRRMDCPVHDNARGMAMLELGDWKHELVFRDLPDLIGQLNHMVDQYTELVPLTKQRPSHPARIRPHGQDLQHWLETAAQASGDKSNQRVAT